MSMQVRPIGGTGSATQTVAPHSPIVLRLAGRAPDAIENRLKKLHADIHNSNLLPPELLPEQTAFCASTPKQLGFFLLNIIEPAIVCYENDADAINTLLNFHDALKQLIQDHLPPEITIDVFLKKCEKLTDKAIKKELKKAHLEERTQKMFEKANELNQLNMSHNQAVNARILQINKHRQLAEDQLKLRLNPLEERMQAIYKKAKESSPEIQAFCKKMEDQEAAIQQLLQQSETVVHGVPT